MKAIPPVQDNTLWFNLEETPLKAICKSCKTYLGNTESNVFVKCSKCDHVSIDYMECLICANEVIFTKSPILLNAYVCKNCVISAKQMTHRHFRRLNQAVRKTAQKEIENERLQHNTSRVHI